MLEPRATKNYELPKPVLPLDRLAAAEANARRAIIRAIIVDGRRFASIKKAGRMSKLLLAIIAVLLPPLAVGLKAGIGFQLLLNIILTLILYLPGLVHALWIVFSDDT